MRTSNHSFLISVYYVGLQLFLIFFSFSFCCRLFLRFAFRIDNTLHCFTDRSLSNTPRLGATVFTNVFRKLLVPPFPPSNTVIFPRFMCSNAFTCSPAISFHWSTILYWIAIAGFDSAALTIASKPSASASNDFFLPSASASSFNWIAFASASACAKVAFARASASRVIFSAMAFA